MTFSTDELAILVECKVANLDGTLVQVDLQWPPSASSAPLGAGPKLDMECIRALLSADVSLRWTKWIFHQAAGGNRGLDGSKQTLSALCDRYVEQRTKGYFDEETSCNIPPIAKTEALVRWNTVARVYADSLHFADQDCVDKAGAYGFYRHWPGGPSKLYARVVETVKAWLAVEDRVEAMNADLGRLGIAPLAVLPSAYATVDELEKATARVERFYVSKIARDDLRYDLIYKSDRVEVLAPLTYAASVRYGHDKWPWSEPKQFESVLTSEHAFNNPWKTAVSSCVYIFVKIHGEVPSWVVRVNEQFSRCYLSNLCLQVNKGNLSQSVEMFQVFNEQNDGSWHLENVRDMLRAEPDRAVEAVEEMPVKRGGRCYATAGEAEAVVAELDKAALAIQEWCRSFDTSRVVVDCLGGSLDDVAQHSLQTEGD